MATLKRVVVVRRKPVDGADHDAHLPFIAPADSKSSAKASSTAKSPGAVQLPVLVPDVNPPQPVNTTSVKKVIVVRARTSQRSPPSPPQVTAAPASAAESVDERRESVAVSANHAKLVAPPAKSAPVPASDDKPRRTVAFFGGLKTGKSTLLGRLLYESGAVDEAVFDAAEAAAMQADAPERTFSWLVDALPEERRLLRSVDTAVAELVSDRARWTVLCAPGHPKHVTRAIAALAQASVGVLVVSALPSNPGGTDVEAVGQWAAAAHAMGVAHVLVAVAKMDDIDVDFSEDAFLDTVERLSPALKQAGYGGKLVFVPVSGWLGDNLTDESMSMDWYEGPTLLGALDAVKMPPRAQDADSKPLRFAVDRCLPSSSSSSSGGGGASRLLGTVLQGVLKPHCSLRAHPGGSTVKVGALESHLGPCVQLAAGEFGALQLLTGTGQDVACGSILTAEDVQLRMPAFVEVQVTVHGPRDGISSGLVCAIHCGAQHAACRVESVIMKLDDTGGPTQGDGDPACVAVGETGRLRLCMLDALCLERNAASCGGVVLVASESGALAATGTIFHMDGQWSPTQADG